MSLTRSIKDSISDLAGFSERSDFNFVSSCVWSFTHPIVAAAAQIGQAKEKIQFGGEHFRRDIAEKAIA